MASSNGVRLVRRCVKVPVNLENARSIVVWDWFVREEGGNGRLLESNVFVGLMSMQSQ